MTAWTRVLSPAGPNHRKLNIPVAAMVRNGRPQILTSSFVGMAHGEAFLGLRVIRAELIDQSLICAFRYRYPTFLVRGMAKCIHRVNLSDREPRSLNRKTWHQSRCKCDRTEPLAS